MKLSRILWTTLLIAVPVSILLMLFYPAYNKQAGTRIKLPDTARSFMGITAEGDSFSLNKYKGKVVFLNFWASWSKASRAENRNIVRVYQKFKDNPKVVFVSISLDTEEKAWKTAIQEDELNWPNQICDYKKWNSDAAKTYGVKTLPANFLIDAKGIIIAQNLKDIEMEEKIREACK